MSEKVFAYGTLRPSLYPGKADMFKLTPIGTKATLTGPYTMLHLGGFPGLIATPDEVNTIIGEVSEVENLNGLDRYEGYPSLYRREQVEVIINETIKETVWVYLYNGKKGYDDTVVESGDWEDAITKRD